MVYEKIEAMAHDKNANYKCVSMCPTIFITMYVYQYAHTPLPFPIIDHIALFRDVNILLILFSLVRSPHSCSFDVFFFFPNHIRFAGLIISDRVVQVVGGRSYSRKRVP